MKFGKRTRDDIVMDDAFTAIHDDASTGFLRQTFGDSARADHEKNLLFCVLGCEPKPPYGPNQHTAKLLLDLIGQAALQSTPSTLFTVSMQVYDVQKGEYPVDWNAYDGFLLPGSFASAYDTDPWILKLQSVLQDVIVAQQRPMLGICFGHQILAHSFASGRVVKVPTGSRGGRYAMPTTAAGACLLQTVSTPSLYYTHGDMVAALPETAVALGGNQQVPIQAAAYYTTQADAAALQQESVDGSSMLPKPYAVTFQAHPEFASTRDLGMYRTLELILDAMQGRGDLTREHRLKAGKDAQEHFEEVQKDSVNVMASVGSLLGWFP